METASERTDVSAHGPVVLFDGVCNLCTGAVQFLIPRDPEARLTFAPIQEPAGQRLLKRHDCATDDVDTIVLVEGTRTYAKSEAVIRIAEILGWPYRLAVVGRVLPVPLRDRLYDLVADNRYGWFGRKEQCMVPDQDVSDRFLGSSR